MKQREKNIRYKTYAYIISKTNQQTYKSFDVFSRRDSILTFKRAPAQAKVCNVAVALGLREYAAQQPAAVQPGSARRTQSPAPASNRNQSASHRRRRPAPAYLAQVTINTHYLCMCARRSVVQDQIVAIISTLRSVCSNNDFKSQCVRRKRERQRQHTA